MPKEYYDYPPESTVYTGVPISSDFVYVSHEQQEAYKNELGLKECKLVVSVIGASQGGTQLNSDMLKVVGRLMQHHNNLGIIHITGAAHEIKVKHSYDNELLADERRRVIVKGFVTDVYKYVGAANVVVSRASATVIAELAVQGKATILVPGQLAGDHQGINARHLAKAGVVLNVAYGDSEELYTTLNDLVSNKVRMRELSEAIHGLAKPEAAKDLANLLMKEFRA